MNALALVVDTLAAYRLTRLVTTDQLTAEARDAVIEAAYAADGRHEWAMRLVTGGAPGAWADLVDHDEEPPKAAILVTCPWCAGMWVALGAVAARRVAPRLWEPLARALALSAGAGIIASAVE